MTQGNNQLERIELALLALTEAVQVTNANINSLVEHLYTRRDVVEIDVLDIKDDLHELKEVTKQQAITADRYAIAAQIQSESVKVQAENIRLLIDMLNRKQA
ncbi:hypothetical protein H6F44_18915 [Pseudanabaena sp. FACHB-1277]|jgi:hypothetical protein|uniref:Uncharacterized protein n=1 Tax=Pseudanabaena cinerea FACHB-1277 TaxID=2949581 RepID=A0A926UVJ7_9CYAN|nr:hypothetical protein [Pseudanabaena cinerea]MBD2152175.1 hypothetical protein [Pseudanabaena cinerea FACHB-1277]